jgi:PAS domain S-box-containing protein
MSTATVESSWLERLLWRTAQSRIGAGVVSLLLLALIFAVAVLSGSPREPASLAYALPVTLAALALGALPGIATAVAASWLWWISEYVDGHILSSAHLMYRQGALVFLAVVVGLLSARLVEAEQDARRVLELAHEGIWTVDLEGRTTFANERLAELFGTTLPELLDSPTARWAGADELFAEHHARPSRGLSEQFEATFVRADGSELPALVSASPVRDATGRIRGVLYMLSDLTAHRRAEEELRAKEAQLALQQELRSRAVELNDAVVQGLALARYLLDAGDTSGASAAVQATLDRAKELVGDLIGLGEVEAGALRRARPADIDAEGRAAAS